MPRETWYVLEDGTVGDPRDVSRDADGRLFHKSGAFVAVGPHGPRSRGVDPATMAKPAPKPVDQEKEAPPASDRHMKPGKGAKYATR